MPRSSLSILCILNALLVFGQQHPFTFFKKSELVEMKSGIKQYPLLRNSFAEVKSQVDLFVGKDVDVPFPKDPAGGYTHDKHKSNYMLMFNSGVLYNLTGEMRYALLVKNMLLKYAALNPVLPNHPQATSAFPGHIFWQALNDANWLVYAGMAYDMVYETLSVNDRALIERGAFKPEVDFFTKDLKDWFDLLHNHSVWACAGVGIVGLASHNKEYVDMALYGVNKDGKRGFIAQMDSLFSPDGYYTEGPYYLRYAILPYMLFANALDHVEPALKIFDHRNHILQKALRTCLQQTNLNGAFFPLNDALKEKDYTTNELVTAIGIANKAYGVDTAWLPVVHNQNRVILNMGGLLTARTIATAKHIPAFFPYVSIESTDGVTGERGGVSVMRLGVGQDLTSLVFKYASQGLSHGHFDRLNINLFDKGNEVLSDYGSVRFIGIEQKFGGRYLPENNAYAAQTIAHNTLVVDEKSHFGGNPVKGEQSNPEKLFSDYGNPSVKVVMAKESGAYPNINMQRSVYLIELPTGKKMVADFFNVYAGEKHQYDFPFQYNGQMISTSFPYQSFGNWQQPLGNANGYQFIWKEAAATVRDNIAQLTFLNNRTYYTLSTWIKDSAEVLLGRTGANDPNFNLRHEPSYIIRKRGDNELFLNLIEIHGKIDPVNEFSWDAYPAIKKINVLQHDDDYSIAECMIGDKILLMAQCNKNFKKDALHRFNNITYHIDWTGPFVVMYDGKKI